MWTGSLTKCRRRLGRPWRVAAEVAEADNDQRNDRGEQLDRYKTALGEPVDFYEARHYCCGRAQPFGLLELMVPALDLGQHLCRFVVVDRHTLDQPSSVLSGRRVCQ